jgi:sterol desaturase/sphingolipid hydroxylase (fatty acid hydroxylase superfamily)
MMREYAIKDITTVAMDAVVGLSRTRANYWAEFVVDIALGIVLVAESLRRHDLHPVATWGTVALGLLLFSFMEYCFHRWLFHGAIRVIRQGHMAHHLHPLEHDALPFFLPALIILALTAMFVRAMPASYAFLLSGTLVFGYVTYGFNHFIIHHTRFRCSPARKWAAYHHIHHYHADCNFGVTTPLWDVILGTRYRAGRKRI